MYMYIYIYVFRGPGPPGDSQDAAGDLHAPDSGTGLMIHYNTL